MSTNPFKAFIPFIVTMGEEQMEDLASRTDLPFSKDPDSGQWRTMGLVPPIKGEDGVVDLEGAGSLMAVQFNERILPGKVRDEQVAKAILKIEKLEGRKVSKKEYATIREEVEFEMLPKAFIRRTVVPVLFRKNLMLVCTSSEKRALDVVAVMSATFGLQELYPWRMTARNDVRGTLTAMAKSDDMDLMACFELGTSAVLKGTTDKQTVRIKDISIEAGKVQSLIEGGEYRVTELGLAYWRDGTPSDPEENPPDLTFSVNEHLNFKRLDLGNINASEDKKDMYALAVICVKTFHLLLDEFVEACGGAAPRPPLASDDDGEL